jgi:hypothetical protein
LVILLRSFSLCPTKLKVKTERTPSEQQLVDVASILAAGILRLRERDSLPDSKHTGNLTKSASNRLVLSIENVLAVVDTKLILNPTESKQVRAVFDLYVQQEG